jgi:hypothetical protein
VLLMEAPVCPAVVPVVAGRLSVEGRGKGLELADGPVKVNLELEVRVPPGVDHLAQGLEGHELLQGGRFDEGAGIAWSEVDDQQQ